LESFYNTGVQASFVFWLVGLFNEFSARNAIYRQNMKTMGMVLDCWGNVKFLNEYDSSEAAIFFQIILRKLASLIFCLTSWIYFAFKLNGLIESYYNKLNQTEGDKLFVISMKLKANLPLPYLAEIFCNTFDGKAHKVTPDDVIEIVKKRTGIIF
jgi:hypothetical protein